MKYSGVILDHGLVSLEYYSVILMPYVDTGCRKVKKTRDCKALHPPNNTTNTAIEEAHTIDLKYNT